MDDKEKATTTIKAPAGANKVSVSSPKARPKSKISPRDMIVRGSTYVKRTQGFIFNHSLWGIFIILVAAISLLVYDIQRFSSTPVNDSRVQEILQQNQLPPVDTKTIDSVMKLQETPTGGGPLAAPTAGNRANPFGE